MAGGMFLRRGDKLVEMTEQQYCSEDVLQALLADYPNLLAGDQIDSQSPRRWLLIAREVALPSEQAGSGRWSVDHLFVDQDGVPTIVEVKRSTNTQIRREIVGQMMDYAANAVVYWLMDSLRAAFENTCQQAGRTVEERFAEAFGPEADVEELWRTLSLNLKAGKLRLLFVADDIPAELRRIIEFLNDQMERTEVLGVEIRQFAGEGEVTLVPRVLGQTAQTEQRKGSAAPRRKWDEARVMEELANRTSPEVVKVARRLLAFAPDAGLTVTYGSGARLGSFGCKAQTPSGSALLFTVYTDGTVWVEIQVLGEDRWREVAAQYGAIEGVLLDTDHAAANRKIPLVQLSGDGPFNQFLDLVKWVRSELGA